MSLVEQDGDLTAQASVSFDENPQILRVQIFDRAEGKVAVIRGSVFEPARPQFEIARPPVQILLQGEARRDNDVQMITFDIRGQQVHQRLARPRPIVVRNVRTPREHLNDAVSLLVVEKVGLGIAVQRSKSLQQPPVVQRDHFRLLHVRDVARLAATMLTAVGIVQQVEVVKVSDAKLPERT